MMTLAQKILLATGDSDWGVETRIKLSTFGFDCSLVREGKECQLSVYKDKYSTVLLDPDLKNHSGIEVLKFLKLNHPSVRVVLIFSDKKRSEEYHELQKNLARVGVLKALVRPFNIKDIVDYLNELTPSQEWKKVTPQNENLAEETVEKIFDKDCTRVDIASFLSGNLAIFDYYIRLKENHFVKIVRRGENIDTARILRYSKEGVQHLYFFTRERRNYINYMNEIMGTTLRKSEVNNVAVVSQIKNVSDKFMEEIHSRGLRPDLADESKAMSENMYLLVKRTDGLREIMGEFESGYPEKFSHSFLVSFFSTIIAKNLEWVGSRTMESITLGALLHDIGLMKLPFSLQNCDPLTLVGKDLDTYKDHCRLGANMLSLVPEMSQQVVQIVYQHHERTHGGGYPNRLTSVKIYPLAKIVALADEFADFIVAKKVSPLEGIKLFLGDREKLVSFDSVIIRALVSGFIKEGQR
ncbi:MAG TPA: HD domain-containing phosphohydrolase [Bacteriovoracaceae bacterium]|nr:HD domain-containing phosphohydrolase [Bacteriovoracaceae bacterium]